MAPIYGTRTGAKPTNGKNAFAADKIPFHLWPETATILGVLGLLDGALKYGRANWRPAGVRASVYYDAIRRHGAAWFECEDLASDSAIHHFGHLLASAAIIIDSMAAGNLVDDRMWVGKENGYIAMLERLTPMVKVLKERHKDKDPVHFSKLNSHVTIKTDPKTRAASRARGGR